MSELLHVNRSWSTSILPHPHAWSLLLDGAFRLFMLWNCWCFPLRPGLCLCLFLFLPFGPGCQSPRQAYISLHAKGAGRRALRVASPVPVYRFGPRLRGALDKGFFHHFARKTGLPQLQGDRGVEAIRCAVWHILEYLAHVCGVGGVRLPRRRCQHSGSAAKFLRQGFQSSAITPALRLIVQPPFAQPVFKTWTAA